MKLMTFKHRGHEEWFINIERIICVRPSMAFPDFGALVIDEGTSSPAVYETAETVQDLVTRIEQAGRVDF